MRRRFFVFFPLSFSILLHLVIAFSCSLHIKAKGNPLFYSWSSIVSCKDLFLEEKEVVFPRGISFPSYKLRKKYFFPSCFFHPYFLKGEEKYDLALSQNTPYKPGNNKKAFCSSAIKKNYFYFWERETVFPAGEGEVVPYRAYISPYGKVLFLYPEKLPLNSYGNLHLQEYFWGAAIFLNNKFFWTKLEGVVK